MTKQAEDSVKLILYHRNFCMFCWRVLKSAKTLGVDLELRNIWETQAYQAELSEAMGRATVPVLRLVDTQGESVWMPESADIIRYMEQHYGS